MIIMVLFGGIVYALLLFLIARSWRFQSAEARPQHFVKRVSILIPFRDEQDHLSQIFSSIEGLSYDTLEVIWINDHSSDQSYMILDTLIRNNSNRFNHLLIESGGIGKKEAIEIGVQCASGEFIMTTDADCLLPENWVNELLAPFGEENIQLVAGPVMSLGAETFFKQFQQIEWASILLLSQFAISRKHPLMCSGANLAYRKDAFQKVGGYLGNKELLSGDDEFLLKKISAQYGSESIVYTISQEALVSTVAISSWNALFQQRIRWASKWRKHAWGHLLAAIFPAFLQVVWLGSFLLPFIYGFEGGVALVFLWLIKVVSEFLALGKVTNHFKLSIPFTAFVGTSLVHPFYVIRTALGVFWKKHLWKGRI